MKRGFTMLFLAIALALPPAVAAQAQAYPDKPVRFIVPFPPGGGTDAFAPGSAGGGQERAQ